MEVITKSAQETKKLGQKFAASLKEGGKNSLTVGLVGELGAGKTTFVQGFAKGLGIKKRVISPTFILIRKYDLKGIKIKTFYHVDLYRLEEDIEREVLNLGIGDIWGKSGKIVVVEWAERIERLMPENSYWINFENLGGNRRKITFNK